MSTEELLDLVADANPKGPAGQAYADTIFRHIGQAQFDPEGMMRDFNQEFVSSFKEVPHLRDEINNKLNSIFTTDPSSELYSMGVWHDGKDLDDSWVKITRELNTDSGKFANGKWTPTPDPTARTSIDILSDIGEGKGSVSDIIDLKNKFHWLKRTLPPGVYHLHANSYAKAMYYLREFKNDPWISLSGEKGGARMEDGSFKKYPTLQLTVPDVDTQSKQVLSGVYPDWTKQGVPRSSLSGAAIDNKPLQSVSEIARRGKLQMSLNSPVSRLNRGLSAYAGKLRKTTLAADFALTGNPVAGGALALQAKPVAKRVVKPVIENVAERVAKLTAKRAAGSFVKTAIPIVGDVAFGGLATAGYLSQGRYKPAAVEVLSTIVGLVPGWGDAISATLDAGQLANDIDYLNRQIGL